MIVCNYLSSICDNSIYLNIILLLNMGLAGGEMEPFIVGGDYIDIRSFPHSIYLYVDCTSTFICGGSVLNHRIVLTAGHCLFDCLKDNDNTIVVHYGHSSIHKMKSLLASQFLVHDKYNEEQLVNDIAMVYTSLSIAFGDVVQRVAILSRFPTRAIGGYVTGWGIKNLQKEVSLTMKYVHQELINRKTCESVLGIPPGTFCAQSNHKHEYPEQGDSGGAFVVYNFVQIGIVSFKHVDHEMIAYTNVTYFYNWIKKSANKLLCGTHF